MKEKQAVETACFRRIKPPLEEEKRSICNYNEQKTPLPA